MAGCRQLSKLTHVKDVFVGQTDSPRQRVAIADIVGRRPNFSEPHILADAVAVLPVPVPRELETKVHVPAGVLPAHVGYAQRGSGRRSGVRKRRRCKVQREGRRARCRAKEP
jgi:hypothetical protein